MASCPRQVDGFANDRLEFRMPGLIDQRHQQCAGAITLAGRHRQLDTTEAIREAIFSLLQQ